MKNLLWICGVICILLSGCNFSLLQTPTPQTSTIAVSQVPALTLEQLQNCSYLAPQYNHVTQLKDGKYETSSGVGIFSAFLQPEVAFGDLNGDGMEDAAVLLAENGGGTGVFVSLIAVLNENGSPMQTATVFIEDRPIINSLAISAGKILLDATLHGPNDPMSNPTEKVSETYQLPGIGLTNLVLIHFISKTPDGSERSITINSPKKGNQVSRSIQVVGSMPIGPFENTVTYRIYDESGNNLAEGPFMVNSDGAGGPASFDAPIDISALPQGIPIRLELVDFSMADGSTLALDSVELVIP